MFIKLYGKNKQCFNILYEGTLSHLIIDILDVDPNYIYNPYIDEIEIGPKTSYKTPWSTNILEIFNRLNITNILRIEKSMFVTKDSELFDKLTMEIYTNDNVFEKESSFSSLPVEYVDIEKYNKDMDLGITPDVIEYYKSFMDKPTNIELYDLAQCNSEHSRHTFFCGDIIVNNENYGSLMTRVKNTINYSNKNNLIAFRDNSSAIHGYDANKLIVKDGIYATSHVKTNFTHNAETHNFPTCISPFEGANTGTGGRIRDTIAVGRGGNFVSGIAGYAVGELNLNGKHNDLDYPYKDPLTLLIESSNGCSDYGNKIGEPVTSGFARSFYGELDGCRVEFIKPILYSAGNGLMLEQNSKKGVGSVGDLIVRVGGPAYPIGMGGGAASSRNQSTENSDSDFMAVQRGDPQMENKLCRFVRVCAELLDENPIISIHDQGSGGMANVTKEIIEPCGALVNLNKVKKGCSDMGVFEVWNAEYQEQCSILINPKDINLVKKIAENESVDLEFVGVLTEKPIIYCYGENHDLPIQLDLKKALYEFPKKNVNVNVPRILPKTNIQEAIICGFQKAVDLVFTTLEVGSKNFLTHKVDRSVTGLIAQQQCVGPFHTPLADYSINAIDFYSTKGVCSAISERPLNGIRSIKSMIEITVGELLTNMVFCPVTRLRDIKVLTNWMWSTKYKDGDYKLVQAVDYLIDILKTLGIAVDGGKDSLSMNIKFNEKIVPSLNTLVLKSYAPCEDFTTAITPEFKKAGNPIFFFDLGYGNNNMGGSVLSKCLNIFIENEKDYPIFLESENFRYTWDVIQNLIKSKIIVSGHDRSDGGLFTTISEMSMSSNLGAIIDVKEKLYYNELEYFFNEELGLIIEVDINKIDLFYEAINNLYNIKITSFIKKIGVVVNDPILNISFNNKKIYLESIVNLRMKWENTSFLIDKKQASFETAVAEYNNYRDRTPPKYHISDIIKEKLGDNTPRETNKPIVGIIREVGSNGDKEMAAAFIQAGFIARDITMNEICNTDGKVLEILNGIAFVGGFSFSDVSGSANGWYSVIKNNEKIRRAFDVFYNDSRKFALGICNGCQLMTKLGWVGDGNWELTDNKSNIFESRFPTVKVKNNNIFTKNMEECIFGIWSSHGEGRFVNKKIKSVDQRSIAFQYVDDHGIPTDRYPLNPNGSIHGTAALTSSSGRHLAIMPHPERCFLKWQLPYIPGDLKEKMEDINYSPWFMLFKNAYDFCIENM